MSSYIDYSFQTYHMFVAVVVLCGLLYRYHRNTFCYWKKLGVPYLEPHWFFGNTKEELLQRASWSEFATKTYRAFKDNGFGGIFFFREPAVVICDPDLIEKVLMQEFGYFHDKWVKVTDEPMLQSLFYSTGDRWRSMRLKVASAFSSNKVRCMFDQTLKCSDCVLENISKCVCENRSTEVGPVASTYSSNVITSCAFGLEFTPGSVEGKQFLHILGLIFNFSPWEIVTFCYKMFHPGLVKLFNLKYFVSEIESYFLSLCRTTLDYRRRNRIERNDLLQMMMTLTAKDLEENIKEPDSEDDVVHNQIPLGSKETPTEERIFSEEAIASTMLSFLIAGTKSVEVTVSFALLEIARNSTIQKTLQDEIFSTIAKHKKWTYDALRDLTYLDEVIQETLRMYTYVPNMSRIVTHPYTIPGTNIVLKRDSFIFIPSGAIHKDPQYYPSPEVFIPERFRGNNYKPNSHYLPFGAGPRICVSIKLAVTMMKVYLARVLEKYTVSVDYGKMTFPLEFDPKKFFVCVKGGIWLKFQDAQV